MTLTTSLQTEEKGEAVTLARRLAPLLAELEALAGAVRFLPHGSRLFRLPAGWQAAAFLQRLDVARCQTLLDLDAALQDENRPVIFLAKDAMMTENDIEKLCQRHGVTKTLFWEERMT